ncbi:hypothetical protein L3Q67_01485 [Saccharothrix sp. AJ9571]|nr:hypothetical protein L3Q67_01485 [Saccharothrix sp. AJ9571]
MNDRATARKMSPHQCPADRSAGDPVLRASEHPPERWPKASIQALCGTVAILLGSLTAVILAERIATVPRLPVTSTGIVLEALYQQGNDTARGAGIAVGPAALVSAVSLLLRRTPS